MLFFVQGCLHNVFNKQAMTISTKSLLHQIPPERFPKRNIMIFNTPFSRPSPQISRWQLETKAFSRQWSLTTSHNLMMVPNNSPAHCTCSKKLSVDWQDNKQLNLSMNLFLDLALVTKPSENQISKGQGMLRYKKIKKKISKMLNTEQNFYTKFEYLK